MKEPRMRRFNQEDVAEKAKVRSMWQNLLTEQGQIDRRLKLIPERVDYDLNQLIDEQDAIFILWKVLPGEYSLSLEGRQGTAIGFVALRRYEVNKYHQIRLWMEITALFVNDAFRGEGYGRVLLDRACQYAEEDGYEDVLLFVAAGNTRALNFYGREGFTPMQAVWARKAVQGG